MKWDFSESARSRNESAFTLVEVVLAVGIVAIAGGLLLASMAQSVQSEGETHARDAAIRLEEVVRLKLQEMGFAEVYSLLQQSDSVIFYAYTYRADREERRSDQTPVPSSDLQGGTIATGFRDRADPDLSSDLETAEGDIFRLRLTSFLHDPGEDYLLPRQDDYREPTLRVYVEVFRDFTPGQEEGTWLDQRKVMAFPVSLNR